MTTAKKIASNRRNAQKSTGPATTGGKEISKMNAVKHAIMTDAVVVRHGDGEEPEEVYQALLTGLRSYFQPVGTMEDILTEQIAVAIWRRRRVLRYEVGCIRGKLDSYQEEYRQKESYGDKTAFQKLADARIRHKTLLGSAAYLRGHPEEDPTAKEFLENYNENFLKIAKEREWESEEPQEILGWLQEEGLSKDKIWEALAKADENAAKETATQIKDLEKWMEFELQREALKGSLPNALEMDKIIRYEAALDRQVFKAINQLERLQRGRKGEMLPPPIVLEDA